MIGTFGIGKTVVSILFVIPIAIYCILEEISCTFCFFNSKKVICTGIDLRNISILVKENYGFIDILEECHAKKG